MVTWVTILILFTTVHTCEKTHQYTNYYGQCKVYITTCLTAHTFEYRWNAFAMIDSGEWSKTIDFKWKSEIGAIQHVVQSLFQNLTSCNCYTRTYVENECRLRIRTCFNYNKDSTDVTNHKPQYRSSCWVTKQNQTALHDVYYCCDYNESISINKAIQEFHEQYPTCFTDAPTLDPTKIPTFIPTNTPTFMPTKIPTLNPSTDSTQQHTAEPTEFPITSPKNDSTNNPTLSPTKNPTVGPIIDTTFIPTSEPTRAVGAAVGTREIAAIVISCFVSIVIVSYCLWKYIGKRKKIIELEEIHLDLLQDSNSSKTDSDTEEKMADDTDFTIQLFSTMNGYQAWQNKEAYIDNIDIEDVLDEYHKLLQCETNEMKRTCNAKDCVVFRRHYRDRFNIAENDTTLYPFNCPKSSAKRQILDKIHCFLQHPIIENVQNDASSGSQIWKYVKERMLRKFNQVSRDEKFLLGWQFIYSDKDNPKQNGKCIDIKIIKPKYKNLRDELVQNEKAVICVEQFNSEYQKAKLHFNCQYRKSTKLWIDNDMTMQHLLALMIYCNFDRLQAEFSLTYRESNGSEHTHFYHLGKLLKEAVHKYGTRVRDGKISNFYHGVTQTLIPTNIVGDLGKGISIFCPLSTSSEEAVAINFACYNGGLIMTFGGNNSKAKYFSVDWISDYAHEKEHFFLQNKCEIHIKNITDYTSATQFASILSGLKAMDAFLFQNHYSDDETSNKSEKVDNIMKILYHQTSIDPMSDIHPYGKKLLNVYFQNKKTLTINYWVLEEIYNELFKLFCFSEYEWIKLDILQPIFPNIEILEIKVKILSPKTLDDIARHRSIFQDGEDSWNLKEMKIELIEVSDSQDNMVKAYALVRKYKEEFRNNKEKLVIDCQNNLIVIK